MYIEDFLTKNNDVIRSLSFEREGKRMFTDYAKILIKSGDGGDGAITFRREKYVAAGRTRWRRPEEMVVVFTLF